MMWSSSGWSWIWMSLVMVVFWGGVIAVVAWVVRRPESKDEPERAVRILEQRFARGEISSEELQDGRRLLGAGPPGG